MNLVGKRVRVKDGFALAGYIGVIGHQAEEPLTGNRPHVLVDFGKFIAPFVADELEVLDDAR